MLKKLVIENFALIGKLELEPGPGLNVFTGETGAGKSIIISALGFILGERAGSDVVRPGAAAARVLGEFDGAGLSRQTLENFGLAASSRFTLQRESDRKGRTRAFINGSPVPLARVSALGSELVDFHGQNEHQSLLKTEEQRSLLDRFGRLEGQGLAVREAFLLTQSLRSRLEAVSMSDQERARLLDLYRFQFSEIQDACLRPGEAAELEALYPRLKNAEKLFTLSNAAYELAAGADGAAKEKLEQALEKLKALGALDEGSCGFAARLESALIELDDISRELGGYSKGLDTDPARLDACLSRLEKIASLTRKYGPDESAVLTFSDGLKGKIADLENLSLDRSDAIKALEKSENAMLKLARALHAARSRAALKLAAETRREAADLGFKELRFEAAVEADEAKISSFGLDSVEYLFSANPGFPLRPLRYTASGGEMSRMMLALKTVLAAADRIGTLVFDEVDTGVGAVTGRLIGQKLRGLSAKKQILCITHLPQVAVFAGKHFVVEKISADKSSGAPVGATVSARELSLEQRTQEIAGMLGGRRKATPQALKHAAELLEDVRG